MLKLDILGHLDPTMIRMLQDLTGIDPLEIPLDSREVMSLFKDTSALGITPEDIGGCKLGALGIPEFGTDFAMQMLIDTKPQYFSDLVKLQGFHTELMYGLVTHRHFLKRARQPYLRRYVHEMTL